LLFLIKDYQVQTEQNIKQLEESCEKERNTWSNSVAELEELYQVDNILFQLIYILKFYFIF
jgi:hypothetical protein